MQRSSRCFAEPGPRFLRVASNRDPGSAAHRFARATRCAASGERDHDQFLFTSNQRRHPMTKVLVLYYSAYGHIETMANAVAEGAREAGATVDIKRVPELV